MSIEKIVGKSAAVYAGMTRAQIANYLVLQSKKMSANELLATVKIERKKIKTSVGLASDLIIFDWYRDWLVNQVLKEPKYKRIARILQKEGKTIYDVVDAYLSKN